MFTVFKHFDVPGVFARDLRKLASFAKMWYEDRLQGFETTAELPKKIVLPLDFLPTEDTLQKRMVLDFVKDLETHLNIKAERFSINYLWARKPPAAAEGQGLYEFLEAVGKDSFLYANYHSAATFRDEYRQRFGKAPFVNPFVQWRWKIGSSVTREEHEESMRRMDVYKEWFLDEVMHVGETNCFVVMQSEDVQPRYRDDPPP